VSNRYLYITLLAVLGWNADGIAQNAPRQVPRLVVNITIDQLRSDFLEAYAPLYSSQGFRRLLEQGCVYENATYPMANLDRASAITSVITGTTPFDHSIVGQQWIDRETLRPQICTETNDQPDIPSPTHIAVSTLGDEMKAVSRGTARVFAIAPFSDVAVLSAGHAADGALWLNEKTGEWDISKYYTNEYATSLLGYSELRIPGKEVKNISWTPIILSDKPIFQHNFKGNKRYQEYQTSGLINDHITQLAMTCVSANSMGADETPDLLCLTYYAGPFNHQPVTDCQEELKDTYMRLDRAIGNLITRLEKKIGQNQVLFVISSTGYCDPEHTNDPSYRIPGGTFYINRTANLLNMYFGAVWGQGHYIETYSGNQLFVNHKLLESKRISLADFCQRAKEFILQMKGVRNVYTGLQLLSGENSQLFKVRNSFHPQHNGDILIEVAPGWHFYNEDTGENYSSQSSAVWFPIIFYGTGIQPSTIQTPVTADRIAPTIARAIRIRAPNACLSEPLF